MIDRGHLYIAQPPLFKVTQNKKDTYLKDESEKSRFLLSRIAEAVEVTPEGGIGVRGEALINMLQRMEECRSHGAQGRGRAAFRARRWTCCCASGFIDRTALADDERRSRARRRR